MYWLIDFSYYRQKLRRLEAALIEYRESLEEHGIKNVEEIENKVALRRKRLEVDYGLSGSSDGVSGNSKSYCQLALNIHAVLLLCFMFLLYLSLICWRIFVRVLLRSSPGAFVEYTLFEII